MFDEAEMEGFEGMLRERHLPAPRRSLSDQIIARAAQQRQLQHPHFDFFDYWDAFWDNFVMPQPSYAVALILLLGIIFGAQDYVGSVMPEMTTQEMVYFMNIDDPQNGDMWL